VILTSKVAIVDFDGDEREALAKALRLIGGIGDLAVAGRSVVVKVGVFDHKAENHTSVSVLDAIVNSFDRAAKIFVVESDNYKGTGSERLQVWKDVYSEKVVPYNLSQDAETRDARIVGEDMRLSHVLFKPNILVSTHILRTFERGSVLKNLFGCIPVRARGRYHKVLPALLADVYEAVGGIDLAVLDGTHFWRDAGKSPLKMNVLLVGRDAVAVETVGLALAGHKPEKLPLIQEFKRRGFGESDLEKIEVVGSSFERLKDRMAAAGFAKRRRVRGARPAT
jgi:uncharacterized protein (DUF362 family)